MTKLQQFFDLLDLMPERQERIDYLIAVASEFVNPSSEEVPRTAENRVPGCESEAYIASEPAAVGRKFRIAVDNPQGISAMAMAVILDQSLSGESPSVVQQVPEDIVYKVFGNELSMGKTMGLLGMVRMVKTEAGKPN